MIRLSLKDLYKQSAELSKLLSSPSNINNLTLEDYLTHLMYFLKFMDYGIDVKISFNQDICIQCSRAFRIADTPNHISLTCQNHLLCSNNCATLFINQITENNYSNWRSTKCPRCSIPLSQAFYEKILGPEFNQINRNPNDFINAQNLQNVEIVENDFNCIECKTNCNYSVCIVLQCGCKYCKDCLKQLLENIIDQADNIDRIKCPKCEREPIDENIIRHVVEANTFEEFERKVGLNFPNQEIRQVVFRCKKANCGFEGQVENTIEEYECLRCSKKSCPKCADVPHIGNSCNAYINWIGNGNLNPMHRSLQWVPCPWCMQYIQKTTKCKFMICNSIICRGQKHFCFECKNRLEQDCDAHNCVA